MDKNAYTCACYLPQAGNVPKRGEILSWAESSAVVYANSVLGAKCNRNSGIIELMGSIAGFVPEFGLLTDDGRRADWIVDTTGLTLGQLRSKLLSLFSKGKEEGKMEVHVLSFGFKHGVPMEADLVFDVRFLPNPYYVPELRGLTGLDQGVRDYVFSHPQSNEFLKRLNDFVSYLLPRYAEEGKTSLVIAVGCTGGHHRSVAVAHALAQFVAGQGFPVTESHRDMGRN